VRRRVSNGGTAPGVTVFSLVPRAKSAVAWPNQDRWQRASVWMQDNRSSSRQTFGVEQQIARLVHGVLPTPDAFHSVRCADISPAGFAFYQATRPDFEELVVALGLPPDLVYMTARVVHTELIELCGHLAFRVGCRFTGQLQLSEKSQAFVRQDNVDSAFGLLSDCADVTA